MNKFESYSGFLPWFMALLLAILLAGCSGGANNSTPTTTASGTAATGAPISGGAVQMVCAGSTAGSAATTGSDGNFTVTAPGSAPCVIRVTGGTGNVGGTMMSIVATASQARVNVNQLTNMLAWLLSGGNPDTGLFQSPGSIAGKVTAAAIATHTATINASVTANLGGAVGISTSFDFLAATFTADGSKFDQLLDNVSFTLVGTTPTIVLKSTGVTLLAVNPSTGVATTTSSTVIGASSLGAVAGAVLPGTAGAVGAAATNPTAISSNPSTGATNVPTQTNSTGTALTGTLLTATFNEAMLASTITTVGTFTLKETTTGTNVPGTVTMNAANTVATFTPTAANLTPNTSYTATISTAAKNAGGTAIPSTVAWKFTTNSVALVGQAPVDLGTAGNFVILSKAGISTTGTSAITGDIGVSPAAATAITGFAPVLDATNVFSKSTQVTGKVFASDYAAPTPANLTTAVSNMEAAYTAAAGRTPGVGPNLNLGSGTVAGQTLAPGVYTWGSTVNVTITGDLTLSGSANDVWIFQLVNGTLDLAAGKKILLTGGALAKNVFWQVSGAVTLGTTSEFQGIILAQTNIAMQTGAKATGRLLAQTAVTLQANTVTAP